ncbi:microtubule motor protein [Aureococcus anophagefferens]|uniref:Microtubule motor protein n=1 Tax=Aureococcus anophagefferens TaxID=44056 RepID=A0ABR1G304_AURAN
MSQRISVSVRVRPLRSPDGASAVAPTSGGGIAAKGKRYDRAFDAVVEGSDQAVAYDAIAAPLFRALGEGYSCTLLAYGQTGSGKTHTERAFDLLNDRAPLTVGGKSAGLKVGGGANHTTDYRANVAHEGTHPHGCSCRKCILAKEREAAERRRRMSERDAGAGARPPRRRAVGRRRGLRDGRRDRRAPRERRGRREARADRRGDAAARRPRAQRPVVAVPLPRVHLRVAVKRGSKVHRRQLLFVDLAGSERILKSRVEGAARDQAIMINASLTALGKVINALGAKAAPRALPRLDAHDAPPGLARRRARAGVVVCVAPDADHGDESVCSLDFGARMATVRTAAAPVAAGADAGDELADARRRLGAEAARLAELERGGFGEWWSPDPRYRHEVDMLKANMARLDREDGAARAARVRLAESSRPGDAAALRETLERREKEARNYRDIVDRQKTIERIYRAPKPAYVAQAAVVRDLRTRVDMLGAD